MLKHSFKWQGALVKLVYTIEVTETGLQLVLDDVRTRTLEVANSVPDSVIEYEACAAAERQGAVYM